MEKKTPQSLQLSQKEKRDLIRSRLKAAPELSNRAIAKHIGCGHHIVGKIRTELTDVGILSHSEPKEGWNTHPYLIANPNLLEGASERVLRALRAEGVLDLMIRKVNVSQEETVTRKAFVIVSLYPNVDIDAVLLKVFTETFYLADHHTVIASVTLCSLVILLDFSFARILYCFGVLKTQTETDSGRR
jgi:hypothetical protein